MISQNPILTGWIDNVLKFITTDAASKNPASPLRNIESELTLFKIPFRQILNVYQSITIKITNKLGANTLIRKIEIVLNKFYF